MVDLPKGEASREERRDHGDGTLKPWKVEGTGLGGVSPQHKAPSGQCGKGQSGESSQVGGCLQTKLITGPYVSSKQGRKVRVM